MSTAYLFGQFLGMLILNLIHVGVVSWILGYFKVNRGRLFWVYGGVTYTVLLVAFIAGALGVEIDDKLVDGVALLIIVSATIIIYRWTNARR